MADSVFDALQSLKRGAELREIEAEVDPNLEAAEIVRRLTARGPAPAVLFRRVRGSEFPLLMNHLGGEARAVAAWEGTTAEQFAARLWGEAVPSGGLWPRKAAAPDLARFEPRLVRTPRCRQVVELGGDIDLARLPFLRAWPQEEAAWLPGLLVVEGAESDRAAARLTAAARLSSRGLAVSWPAYDPAWELLAQHAARGEKARAAFVIGLPPLVLLSALLPRNEAQCPWLTAGVLAGKPLELAAGKTQAVRVPAAAELVIEGEFDLAAPRIALPPIAGACDATLPANEACLLEATAVTHAADAIPTAVLPEAGRGELAVLGRTAAALVRAKVLAELPTIRDLHCPAWAEGLGWFGPARPVVFAAIEKRRPGEGIAAARRLAACPELAGARLIVVVEGSIDPAEEETVWRRAIANGLPARDWQACDGGFEPLDRVASGTRGNCMLLDATFKLPEEGGSRGAIPQQFSEEVRRLVAGRWREYGLD